jgi:phosphoglycolate phosphatase-like HAD superfamily hydrolase
MHKCSRSTGAPEEVELNNVIIFDLDGVITSEEAYWITAGLVLHELLFSPHYWNITGTTKLPPALEEYEQVAHATLPIAIILKLKARSINSNWDTGYVAACICLIDLLAKLPDCTDLFPLRPGAEDWIAAFRHALAQIPGPKEITPDTFRRLDDPFFKGITGLALIDSLNGYASHVLGMPVEGVFARYSQSWMFCQDLFQQWYLGDALYTPVGAREHDVPIPTGERNTLVGAGLAPAYNRTGKHGVIHQERPLLSVETLRATLRALRERGYLLGIATGRQRQEALSPLKDYGLLNYFDESHITTHTEIALAEEALRERDEAISLVKPHPYQFLLAANPQYLPNQPLPPPGSFIVVGDTPSDVRGGCAANAITVAVLTGARTAEARTMLEQSKPDFLIEDITRVPALLDRIDDLLTIQRLQFTQRQLAELLLQRWFARHMDLRVEQVTLMPKAVSLNSFNGIYRANNEDCFFKTHVEDKGILEEYYHAEMLFNAGYNVVKPLRTLHEKGQQMVIYPVVHDPVMFDLMRAVEIEDTIQADRTDDTTQANRTDADARRVGARHDPYAARDGSRSIPPNANWFDLLIAAEQRECERLLEIYEATLQLTSAEEHAKAPIHQLFWHRLTGERLTNFYGGKPIPLPETSRIPLPETSRRDSALRLSVPPTFEELLHYRWVINGVKIDAWKPTLGELLEQARTTLHPAREMYTVIGHGDAHFGNVFLENQKYYKYFDPAFAGRHSPLLDIVKPFFHNVFAMWMYFPDEIARELQITVEISNNTVYVEHNYVLPAIRRAIWETKIEHLLKPLLALLREHDALPPDWFDFWRLAMLCCPLLTVNLLDVERRPASICWLGLSQVMEMRNLEVM